MPKQLITDLLNEMQSKCISDVFEIEGHKYEMQLLNAEETEWRNTNIPLSGIAMSKDDKPSISIGVVNAFKRPTLAISIKSIDDESVESLFEGEWKSLNEKEREGLLAESIQAKKWFSADRLFKTLADFPGDVIEALWKNYDILGNRRKEVQEEVKKSSGESEKTEDSAQLSPSGEK